MAPFGTRPLRVLLGVLLLLLRALPGHMERCALRRGTRVLVAFPSYGKGGAHNPQLRASMRAIAEAGHHGVHVDVLLILTHPPTADLRVPGLREVRHEVHDPSIGHGLVERWREPFREALRDHLYDIYAVADHDMAITYRTMRALCHEYNRLEGTSYFPGILRYETLSNRSDAPRFLPDNSLCCDPQIAYTLELQGRKYLAPHNPYMAMFLAPAADLDQAIKDRARRGHNMGKWKVDPRAYWATYWLHNEIRTMVVPLEDWGAFLVHHQGDRYVQDARRLLEENCVDISDADEITAYLNQKPGHWGGVRTLPTVADYVAAAQAWPVGQRGLALGPRNALDYGRFYSEGPATYGRPEHCDRPATGGRVRALEPRAQGKRLRQWLPMLVALGLTLWVVLFMAVYVYAKS